jgi:hypothetical protein
MMAKRAAEPADGISWEIGMALSHARWRMGEHLRDRRKQAPTEQPPVAHETRTHTPQSSMLTEKSFGLTVMMTCGAVVKLLSLISPASSRVSQ